MTPAAVANIRALDPPKRSKVESAWEQVGPVYIAAEFEARVVWTAYEPVSLRLPGGWYKVDFVHVLETGQMVFVEVKSRRGGYGYTNSRTKIHAAAEVYPFWTFVQATGNSRGFELETIT